MFHFSLKVFKGCGQPRLGKRSATTSEINFESVKFDRAGSGGSGTGGANVRPTTAAGTSLDRLVRDIKQKVGFKAISSLSLSLVFQTQIYPATTPLSQRFFHWDVCSFKWWRVLCHLRLFSFWRHLWLGSVNQNCQRDTHTHTLLIV